MHGHGFIVSVQANISTGTASYPGGEALYLQQELKQQTEKLDYSILNNIIGLENPTREMLSSWIWAQLAPQMPQLKWVSVYETASFGSVFDGTNYQIWKDTSIDSAIQHHEAPASDASSTSHGDTFNVRLNITAALDKVMGWTVDFGDVKTIFDPVFKALDHWPLYQYPEFKQGDTVPICRFAGCNLWTGREGR